MPVPAGHEAFRDEIASAPDDDTPRLVYADWLESRGDPRGEFIRIQCRLTAGCAHKEGVSLRKRERQLLAEFGAHWRSELPAGLRRVEFRRGFVEKVETGVARFLAVAADLFAVTPLRGVVLTSGASRAAQLAASEHLGRLAHLHLEKNAFGDAGIGYLANASLGGLLSLKIHANDLHAAGLKQLLGNPALARLETLDLTYNPLGDAGLRELASAAHLDGLRCLRLPHCEIGSDGLRELFAAERFARLETLDVSDCPSVANSGLRALAEAQNAAALKRLVATSCRIGDSGLRALARTERLDSLSALVLNFNQVTDRGLRYLAASPLLARLEKLRLSSNDLGYEGVAELVDSPYWNGKTSLNLAKNNISQERVRELRTRFGKTFGNFDP